MLNPRKKISRKELKHDPLMEGVYRVQHFYTSHQKRINTYIAGGLAVLFLSLLGYRWRNTQNEKASAVAGIIVLEYGQSNYREVVDRVSPVLEEFGGLPGFGSAVYMLARSELTLGDSVQAWRHYQLYLDDYSGDPLLEAGALSGLGMIAEGDQRYLEAADFFRRASRIAPTGTLQQNNAVFAGRSYLLGGDQTRALKLLRSLLEEDNLNLRIRNEAESIVAEAGEILRRK